MSSSYLTQSTSSRGKVKVTDVFFRTTRPVDGSPLKSDVAAETHARYTLFSRCSRPGPVADPRLRYAPSRGKFSGIDHFQHRRRQCRRVHASRILHAVSTIMGHHWDI